MEPAATEWPAEFTAQVMPRIEAAARAQHKIIPQSEHEDFEADLLIVALKSWPKFDPRLGKVTTWLGNIARRKAIDRLRFMQSESRRMEHVAGTQKIEVESAASWLEHRYDLIKRQALTFRPPRRGRRLRRPGGGRKRLLSANQAVVLLAYQAHARCSLRELWRLLGDEDVRAAIQLSRCPAWPCFLECRKLGLVGNSGKILRDFWRQQDGRIAI